MSTSLTEIDPGPPSMYPWRLELGQVEQHELAIEQLGPELVLSFVPPAGGAPLPWTRIMLVQPGSQVELPPSRTPARSLSLPRARAPLDDLWLLLRTGTRRYWLEVPYGLCGSPDQPCDAPQLGPPRSPPDEAPEDVVLAWQAIRFRLGPAGGWQLAVVARQGRTGELEIEARRGEPGIPPALSLTASVGTRLLAIEQDPPWGTEPAPLHVARCRFSLVPLGARAYVRLLARCGAATFELQPPTSLTDRSHRFLHHRREPAR